MVAELVLITGGAGFIGSALAARLAQGGRRVRILDTLAEQVHGADPATTSASYRIAAAAGEIMVGSVTSRDDLSRALEGVDAVVHLAAETGTGQSMYEVARYVETNVGGTALLLDLLGAHRDRVRKLVVASSRAVYGEGRYRDAAGGIHHPSGRTEEQLAAGRFDPLDPADPELSLEPVPTPEDARLAPVSVYGVTKLAQEQLVLAAAPALGLAAVALRYQNVYGPGQALRNPYTGILTIFAGLIRDDREVNVFEDGRESRDFVFIDDVVAATAAALEPGVGDGLVVNVGSGEATSVLQVVRGLEGALGTAARSRITGNYRVGDIRHSLADLSLARKVLGFEPRVSFAEGVRTFGEWVVDTESSSEAYERSLAELRARNLLK